ncbi:MAG: efflux RND transporter periplasmic adaptor subunit [Pseudomonadota bacterium]
MAHHAAASPRQMIPQALRWNCAVLLGCLFTPAWGVEIDCLIEPHQITDVRSPVDGVLESVAVQRGQQVRKGQVLATLQSDAEKAALEVARTRAEMDGAVKAAEARLDAASKKEQRTRELFEKNFVSSGVLEEARTQRSLAEHMLREAREAKRLAELELRRSAELLRLRTLRAPFDGVVTERYLDPGGLATAAAKDPILRIAQIDPLSVEVILGAGLYGKVKVGQTADVTPETSATSFPARVTAVDRVIDAASGTFRVRLELPNPKQEIPAGAKCKVRLPD